MRTETHYDYGLWAGLALYLASYVFLNAMVVEANYQPSLLGPTLLGAVIGLMMLWLGYVPRTHKPLRRAGVGVLASTVFVILIRLAFRAAGVHV